MSRNLYLKRVRFLEPVEGWPVGTEGTVVEAREAVGIVEVDDRSRDLIDCLAYVLWSQVAPVDATERKAA